MIFRKSPHPPTAQAAPDRLEEIRARHSGEPIAFEIESHRHGQRGCRCLSCDVTTGYLISVGVDCDETPEASNAYDGGCLVDVVTWEQAELLVAAPADARWLLGEVDRLRAILGTTKETTP